MAKPLLSLCSIPKITTRDGWTGANARLYLPFYGYWFATGADISFPKSTIAQDPSPTLSATVKPDTFQKSYGICIK